MLFCIHLPKRLFHFSLDETNQLTHPLSVPLKAPVTVDKFLGTKPLRSVISQRAGPGGRKLDYMAGETVTQTLNDAFGYDGWSMEVKDKTREVCIFTIKTLLLLSYFIADSTTASTLNIHL